MPELHFWFTGTAIYLFGSFAFAVAVGLIGIKDMVSRRLFYVLIIFAVVFSGLAWKTAAVQEKSSSEQEAQAGQIKSSLGRIASALSVDPDQGAKRLAEEILKKLPSDWVMTDEIKTRLRNALDEVRTADRPKVVLAAQMNNSARAFTDEIGKVFQDAHWDVSGSTDTGVSASLKGIFVAVSPSIKEVSQVPRGGQLVARILSYSGIFNGYLQKNGIAPDNFQIVIAEKPRG